MLLSLNGKVYYDRRRKVKMCIICNKIIFNRGGKAIYCKTCANKQKKLNNIKSMKRYKIKMRLLKQNVTNIL